MRGSRCKVCYFKVDGRYVEIVFKWRLRKMRIRDIEGEYWEGKESFYLRNEIDIYCLYFNCYIVYIVFFFRVSVFVSKWLVK